MGCWLGLSAVLEQQHSTIVDWTLYGPGVPGGGAKWYWHRGGYFAAANKIYLLGGGSTAEAWVLDLDSQTWTTDPLDPSTAISQDGQFGAVINDAYYFMNSKIQKYVPGILNNNFADAGSGSDTKCYTANEK
eukprot:419325_1